MLGKGQVELKLFNNQYSQTKSFDASGKRVATSIRESWFTSNLQILYGLGKRINVGAEANYRLMQTGSTFFFNKSTSSRDGITTVGPKIKVAPNAKWNHFTVQSTLLFPLDYDLEGPPWLDYQAVVWVNQVFWDHSLGTSWLLFTQLDVWGRFGRNVETPLKLIVSKLFNSRLTFYGINEFTPELSDLLSTYYIQTGLGAKYQLFPNFEVEALYTLFVAGKQKGAGETYNIGLRYLR